MKSHTMNTVCLSTFSGIAMFWSSVAQAQLINVDFNNDAFDNYTGPTMSGAAVFGTAGSQWNGLNNTSATVTGVSLFDSSGAATSAKLSYASDGSFDVIQDESAGSDTFTGTPYQNLMEDFLTETYGNVGTITISGLGANSMYNLVLFSAADNAANGTTARGISITANGNAQTSIFDGTTSTLVQGVDYVQFTPVFTDSSGNMNITFTALLDTVDGYSEADINGFQILAVPEPGTIALSALSGITILALRRLKATT